MSRALSASDMAVHYGMTPRYSLKRIGRTLASERLVRIASRTNQRAPSLIDADRGRFPTLLSRRLWRFSPCSVSVLFAFTPF